MPYTLKSNRAKFRNANGDYKEFDLISENSTASQIAAIEAKGTETRESIPSDYTEFYDAAIKRNKYLNFHGQSLNYGTLTNMNTAQPNTCYSLSMAYDIKTSIQNLPSDAPLDGLIWYALTLGFYNQVNATDIYTQYFFKNDLSIIYKRQYESGVWDPWKKIKDETMVRPAIIVDKSGSGDYTSFTAALAAAYSIGNVDIYVKSGIYDITQEINVETAGSGPVIGKGIRLYFEPNAIIQCYYTGSSSSVKNTFSPLNAGNDSGFEIHNMTIRCKNVRYCVHDEHNDNATPYINRYINCNMYLDNSASSWDSPQCIGGGLGKYGIIEIEGGYYEGTPHAGDNTYGEISYHNSIVQDAQSEIHISNVFCKNNTVRFGYYGASTKITKCFVNACSLAVEPLVRPETQSSVNVNMEMLDWSNTIRS